MANGAVQIVPDEVNTRRAELEALRNDAALTDALNRLNNASLAVSKSTNKDNCILVAGDMKTIKEAIDILIDRSIGLFNDTQKYFVDVDQRLAKEI